MPVNTTAQEEFQGFELPTTTPVPDAIFDYWLSKLTGSELKVLLYIVRRTFGFKKASDDISLNQICNGIVKKNGEVLDYGTGLSKDAVARAVKRLEERGIITRNRRRSNEKGDEPTTYTLNFLPVSENMTPPTSKIGHPRVRKSDTQETVRQETVRQDISFENSKAKKEENDYVNLQNAEQRREDIVKAEGSNGEAVQPSNTSKHRTVETIETEKKSTGAARNSGNKRPAPQPVYDENRQILLEYIKDFAHEFRDNAKLRSSVTRAHNLQKQSGLSIDAFITVMYEARLLTKERTGSVRQLDETGFKSRMAYFFAVLEDKLGLREPPPARL